MGKVCIVRKKGKQIITTTPNINGYFAMVEGRVFLSIRARYVNSYGGEWAIQIYWIYPRFPPWVHVGVHNPFLFFRFHRKQHLIKRGRG